MYPMPVSAAQSRRPRRSRSRWSARRSVAHARSPIGTSGARTVAVRAAVAVVGAATLAACGGSSGGAAVGTPTMSALGSGQPTAVTAVPTTAAAGAPHGLTATGGLSADILGTFQCQRTGSGYTVQLTQGATQLSVVTSSLGKISSAVYGTVGQTFGGPSVHGLGGTVIVKGATATFTNVTLPSQTSGPALVLNGTVPCA